MDAREATHDGADTAKKPPSSLSLTVNESQVEYKGSNIGAPEAAVKKLAQENCRTPLPGGTQRNVVFRFAKDTSLSRSERRR
jgi:hypothetical protein